MLSSKQQVMLQHSNYLCGIDSTWFLQAGHPVFSNLGLSARTEIFQEMSCKGSRFCVLAYFL